MGYWKKKQIEEWDQGFHFPPDKHVCAKHFDDKFLKQFVSKNSQPGVCDYCGKKSSVIPLNEIVAYINEKIKDRFTNLDDANLPLGNTWLDKGEESDDFLKRVGLYVLPKDERYWDADDFFGQYLHLNDDDLFCDIAGCFSDKTFCRNMPLYPSWGQELSMEWNSFCLDVKNNNKYSFHNPPQPVPSNQSNNFAIDILTEIEGTILHQGLIKSIPIGRILYRCRKHKANESATTFGELASPPLKFATNQNRMSPNGVSMFYGADTLKTAQLEAQNIGIDDASKMISWGKFETITPIKVIDFTNFPKYKGLWSGDDYEVLNFLYSFVQKISEPLDKKEEEIKGYLPTQILTGYIKSLFTDVEGLIYPSAKKENGKCFVLFYDADECPKHLKLLKHKSLPFTKVFPTN